MKRSIIGVFALILCAFLAASATAEEKKETVAKKEAEVKKAPEKNKGHAVIETKLGNIEIEFFPEVAPKHVENFKGLAKKGFYNGTTFHRVIPGFMIQGGDPNSKDNDRKNDGAGDPGYKIKAEFNSKKHVRGIVSMARANDPDSAGSQFFICVADYPSLDGQYTVFGRVVKGMEVADKIANVPRETCNSYQEMMTKSCDNPLEKVEMKKVYVVGE